MLNISKKGYVSITVTEGSNEYIDKLLSVCDIPIKNKPEEYHCTLMYDISNPSIKVPVYKRRTFAGRIVKAVRIGEGTKWDAVALLLKSPDMEKRFEELTKAGMKHSYEKIIPHVSLAYNLPSSTITAIISCLNNFLYNKASRTVLLFQDEKFEKIKS